MILNKLKPRKSLNKAYLKVKPNRSDIEVFKENLINLIDQTNDTESEEFHKNLVSDFLKKTYYGPNHSINTKGRNDLVIHNGKNAKSTVGVIIEAKKPTNKNEMVTKDNLNKKAFQELVLYYLRERISQKNLEIKYLIATNINEWFVFDATTFDRFFAQDKKLVKQFEDFEGGRLADTKTDFFYKQVAEPFIEQLDNPVDFTHFDLRDYDKPLRNEDKKDDNKLIALFKLLSPEHLLKLPFANDSNSLDKKFYSELLHIIGLTETKDGGKKVIQRNKAGEQNSGSLLENAMTQLDTLDKVRRLENLGQYGETMDERLFNVGLELSITWVNRILFLKLLEAQLIAYHKGDESYSFLNFKIIKNYGDLNSLFFQVLAKKHHERNEEVKKEFAQVPYLNSSLFEPNELEHNTILISNLRDEKKLPILSNTVLKDENGKKRTGELNALEYFFAFLEAYDFSSEGSEEIQEENKSLINASVLGLIFEKINGYKDGSFFTPGFITMYMCRETIRKAVVQKFNDTKGWECKDLDDLYDKIEDRQEANAIVNSLKICDPAVGSGHFLVSALNEMIAIKNDLKIFQDRDGKRLKEYVLEVVNDELVITDDDGELFEYSINNKESQRLQETLFHEKQTIIENCLFGVDINLNSVKICRLRLWIELLKNAYYKNETELETLPNIDINIKCGNSLISCFALTDDLSVALRQSKWNIESYQLAVQQYRHATNKEEKRQIAQLISDIKRDFRTTIRRSHPLQKKLDKLGEELFRLTGRSQFGSGMMLFEPEEYYGKGDNKKQREEQIAQIEQKIEVLTKQLEDIKNNKIYENAFEWRFEFPEVLNNEGDFIGFDIVIGNPPYGAKLSSEEKEIFLNCYLNQDYQLDTYLLFIERSYNLMKSESEFSFIIPNTWLTNIKFESIRKFICEKTFIHEIVHYKKSVFEEAVVNTESLFFKKRSIPNEHVSVTFYNTIEQLKTICANQNLWIKMSGDTINISLNEYELNLKSKISKNAKKLDDIVNVVVGVKPYQVGKGKPKQTREDVKNRTFDSKFECDDSYKPLLRGSDINKYVNNWKGDRWIKYGDHLAEPRYTANFNTDEKILVRQTGDTLIGTLDTDRFITMNNIHVITPKAENTNINFKYLLGLINCKLLDFYHFLLNPEKGEALAEIKRQNLAKIPVRLDNSKFSDKIESKVTQILALKKENPKADTSALEAEIDQLVYELYGLTEEEIKIVEESVK